MSITTISVRKVNFSSCTWTFSKTPSAYVIVPSTTHIIDSLAFISSPLIFLKVGNDIMLMLAPRSHTASPR